MISRIKCASAVMLAGLICVASVSAEKRASQSPISFLDRDAARVAIVDDSMERYFDQLQPMEMAAKTGSPVGGRTIEEQRTQCRKRYQAGVRSFSESERSAIQWHVDKLTPILAKDYPLMGTLPWSFLKVSDEIEGGLPHTRGDHIILSQSMCNQIVMIKQQPIERMIYLGILDLLIHEQMHVFQRTHPGHCDSMYTDLWGFKKSDAITGCRWLAEHHLANPDAVDCSWVLPVTAAGTTSYLWPIVVFAEGDAIKTMPGDFRMLAISLQKSEAGFSVELADDERPAAQDLKSVPQFRELFPLSSNIYHPNEASADMFAKVVIFDSYMPQANPLSAQMSDVDKHLAPLRKWFKENLKAADGTHLVKK
jgi:hypothetical protein